MRQTILLWILAVVLTLASVVYQRMTGPNHPVNGRVEIDGTDIDFELLRSYDTTGDAAMAINVPDRQITGEIRWRRFKSNDTLMTESLTRDGDDLIITIPKQPMAGKVIYQISLIDKMGQKHDLTAEPIILRYNGPVPSYVLGPHILFMFVGMMLATRAGLEAIAKRKNAYRFSIWTTVLLFVGGAILGPLVQKFAFDTYWAGWPLGHDLTDNKTMAALIFWTIALWRGAKAKEDRGWIITAAIVTLVVFLIPHSLLGSELDYTQMGPNTQP